MVTVIDPHGTPVPVYTRSGTTIQTVVAAGTNLATATPIVAPTGWSIVLLNSSTGNEGVILPEDAEIGDIVEAYAEAGNTRVYPPTGEVFNFNDTSVLIDQYGAGYFFRKATAGSWRYIRS